MKRSKTGLIIAIIVLLLGAAFSILLYREIGHRITISELLFLCTVLLLPGIILISADCLAARFPLRKTNYWYTAWVGVGIVSAIIVIYIPFLLFAALAFRPDTDLSHYQRMRDENCSGKTSLMAHFPKTIPHEAKDVKYFALPGVMQGGSTCKLQFTAPLSYIRKELQKYLPRAKHVYKGTTSAFEEDGNPTSTFEGWPNNVLPEDFTVVVLEAKPYRNDGSFNWNHGSCSGIACSTKRRQVIYWGDDW